MGAGFGRARMNIWPRSEAGPAVRLALQKVLQPAKQSVETCIQVRIVFMAHLLVGLLSCLAFFSCFQHKLICGC